MDANEGTFILSAEEKLDQTNLRSDIEKLTLMEETSWRQKSRVLHLKEGDANTKFFRRMANSNRKNNGIEGLMVNDTLSSDQGIIADHITHFFMNLYSEQQVERPFPDSLVFPRYYVCSVDVFSNFFWLFPIASKSDVCIIFHFNPLLNATLIEESV